MKIGILTFHRAHNYGAMLQAFALMNTLKSLGHQVEFIDYWPEYRGRHYSLFDPEYLLKRKGVTFYFKAKRYLKILLTLPYRWVKHSKFTRFLAYNLQVKSNSAPLRDSIPDKYDVVVCGSDQIWRYFFRGQSGFDEVYFAKYPVNERVVKISYAASMGDRDIDESGVKSFATLISNFDRVSVREDVLLELAKPFTTEPPVQVVDPVFLMTASDWKQLIKPVKAKNKRKYLLFYHLLNSAEAKKIVNKIAKERNLEIIEIRGSWVGVYPFYPTNLKRTAGPIDFIELIAHADYVVSSSYHGIAFSIIFQKQFSAVGFRNKKYRIKSLLKVLGLEQCLIETSSDILPDNIDYTLVNSKLEEIINNSLSFLKTSINITKNVVKEQI